jgi:hypothetical protein
MTAFKIFGRKKKRKYPIKRDENGKSARNRCFEMFADNTPIDEIAEIVGVKIDTVRRYHLQWKKNPNFERQYVYIKGLFKRTSPDRDKNIELFSRACGITNEQLETILSRSHGLRRLMTGKFYLPAYADADHKRSIAFEVALLITDHLIKNGGQFEDVYYALKRYMQENVKYRAEEDADIKEENEFIALVRTILAADMEKELQGRVKEERLTEEERAAAIKLGLEAKSKRAEKRYWIHIGELMAEGNTEEQAREKMYQFFLDNGDPEGAKKMRTFQNFVHPLKTEDQGQPPSPLQPPLPT